MSFHPTTRPPRSHRHPLLSLGLVAAVFAPGCATMNHTDRGILSGGGVGAVAGALAGSAVGRPLEGVAIGAGVGGVSGGLIGNAIDRSEERQEARQAAAAPARGPLGLTDVAALARQQVSDDVIVTQIRTTGSAYNLSANDIVWLKQNGVSDAVVREMQMTARLPRRVYGPPPVYPVPVVIAEPCYPPPPPPVHFGIGVGWHGRRCR